MIMKNEFLIYSVLIIIITACIAGCSSPQSIQTSPQSNSPTVTTTLQTQITTAVPEMSVTSLASTTTPAPTILQTIIPMNDGITLTLNSAEKQKSLGNGLGKPGRVLLILDITLKNNNKNKDFVYTDNSFIISYKSKDDSLTAITSQYTKQLNNPLISGFVPSGSTSNGKILFGVNETSNSYKLSVADSTGSVLASIDNINVP
jgi:hypothetical protein